MIKKFVLVIAAVVLSIGICQAEDASDVNKPALSTNNPSKLDRPCKKEFMQKEGMKDMMKMMMPKTMIASNDGGVIILAGNKLLKYDSNLVLVKEVEIKAECPMAGKMPMKDMDKAGMDMPAKQKDAPEETEQ